MQDEVYFSIDIETDGLCPGLNSMISLGAVEFEPYDKKIGRSFKVNILPLSDTLPDPDTMHWWANFPHAYRRATEDAIPAAEAMKKFVAWVEEVAGERKKVACYWKPEFDGAFIRYYLFRFNGSHVFGRSGSGLDIKTLTALALGQNYSETQIATVPKDWGFPCGKTSLELSEHNHDALDDAREQANVCIHAAHVLGEKGV